MALRHLIFLALNWPLGLGAAATLDSSCSATPVESDALCAPGRYFDLAPWGLELNSGGPQKIQRVRSKDLQGCNGYSDPAFYASPETGHMVLAAPSTGCDRKPGSRNCCTELRELSRVSGSNVAWSPSWINTLNVNMTVLEADDVRHDVVIGQVISSLGTLAELYYNSGEVAIGVKSAPDAGRDIIHLGWVPAGQRFTYEISYSVNHLSAIVNGRRRSLNTSGWDSPPSYFKVGNCNQPKLGPSPEIHIAAIDVKHLRGRRGDDLPDGPSRAAPL